VADLTVLSIFPIGADRAPLSAELPPLGADSGAGGIGAAPNGKSLGSERMRPLARN
jgi:hypothetical protein